MPTYAYECNKCDLIFEEFHSMSETIEKCKKCDSLVKRVVSKNFNIKKNNYFAKKKPGAVVREYIRDARESTNEHKDALKKKEYGPK